MGVKVLRLNKEPTEYCVGTVYEAAWTAASSNVNGARLTDSLTLPAGAYMVTVGRPYFTGVYFAGLNVNGAARFDCGVYGPCYTNGAWPLRFTQKTTLYMESRQSAPCELSYLERGRLRAVRIA